MIEVVAEGMQGAERSVTIAVKSLWCTTAHSAGFTFIGTTDNGKKFFTIFASRN